MVRKRGVARTSFARRRVRRVKKYDHNVIPLRFKVQLPDMADRLKPPLNIHVECEVPTMELLETLNVPTAEWVYYLGFMKRMVELYRNFTSATLQSEKDSLISEYVLRGKDRDVLEEVQEVAALCSQAVFEMDLWTRDFYKMIEFEDVNGYENAWVGSSAAFTITEGICVLSTGGDLGSDVGIRKYFIGVMNFLTWDKERRLRVSVVITSDADQEGYIVMGRYEIGAGTYIGFKFVNNELFGCVRNGGAETLTAALYTFTGGEELVLEVRYKPNQEAVFYVNGTELGSLTTGFPSSITLAEFIFSLYIINTAAANKELQADLIEFYQKR